MSLDSDHLDFAQQPSSTLISNESMNDSVSSSREPQQQSVVGVHMDVVHSDINNDSNSSASQRIHQSITDGMSV